MNDDGLSCGGDGVCNRFSMTDVLTYCAAGLVVLRARFVLVFKRLNRIDGNAHTQPTAFRLGGYVAALSQTRKPKRHECGLGFKEEVAQ